MDFELLPENMRTLEDIVRDRIVEKVMEYNPACYKDDDQSKELLGHVAYAIIRAAASGGGEIDANEIIDHFYSGHDFYEGEVLEIRRTLEAIAGDSGMEAQAMALYFLELGVLSEGDETDNELQASVNAMGKLLFR